MHGQFTKANRSYPYQHRLLEDILTLLRLWQHYGQMSPWNMDRFFRVWGMSKSSPDHNKCFTVKFKCMRHFITYKSKTCKRHTAGISLHNSCHLLHYYLLLTRECSLVMWGKPMIVYHIFFPHWLQYMIKVVFHSFRKKITLVYYICTLLNKAIDHWTYSLAAQSICC